MADVELRVTADLDQATKEVAGFSKAYAEMVKQVEKPLRQVNATRDLEAGLEATSKEVQTARKRLQELQRELIATDYPTETLKESFKQATKELQKLERVEAQQANQLSRMRAELKGAGVDTTRLAAEQRRLNSELTGALGAGRNEAAARGIRDRAAALKQQAVAQRQANMEAARENLGVNRYRELQAEIKRAAQQYEQLRRSGKLSSRELAVAQQQLTQRIRESKQALQELAGVQVGGGALSEIGGRLGVGGGVVAGVAGGAALAAQYAAAIDPIKNMRAQLDLATDSQEELNQALAQAARIAEAAGAPLTDTAELYAKLIPPVKELGGTQQDAANTTEAFALGLRISGATAQQSAAAMQQYVQALNRGVFQAEEFNSVSDGNIRLIRAFADELGITVGQFRNMVLEGKITSDMLLDLSNRVLPKLRAEAELMPETWAAATTKLNNSFQQLLGQFDQSTGASQALIDKIDGLTASLNLLAEGAADKVAIGVGNIASEVARLVPILQLASIGADNLVEALGLNTFSQSAREEVAEEGEALEQRKTQFDMHAAEMKAAQQRSAGDLKAIQEQQVKDTETALKQQIDAEKTAARELETAKEAQLETQRRYQQALANLNAGPAQEPSYAQASALKAGARQALQRGDVDEAKRQAQAALAVLEELANAGENTYGFAGFIKELQAIEESADQIGIDDAQKKLDAAKQTVLDTKKALEDLKKVEVAPTLDEEATQKLLNDLAKLAKDAGIILTVPVTPVAGAAPADPVPAAGYAGGGYTGPGGVYEPAGVVHKGEVVWSQLDIARAGGVAVVEAMRRGLRGYSMGGVVAAPRMLPPIPQIAPALQAQLDGPSFPDLGRVAFDIGGDSFTAYMEPSQADDLRKLRLKFGGTKRR